MYHEQANLKNEQWRDLFLSRVSEWKPIIKARGIRQLTFRMGQYPRYFALCKQEGAWLEEEAILNIKPPLAFQLEPGRLSLQPRAPTFVERRQIHIYQAVARESQLDK